MNEAVLDKKIKIWEDQLLDLGKRNKMISYRESKSSTLKILNPDFDELYQKLVIDEEELTFQKAIDRDTDARVYSVLTLLNELSCPIEVCVGDIKAEGSSSEIQKTLKQLRAKARLSMDEQGTNILYMVFGFIEWRERGNGDTWLKSPILLVPVSLTLPSINAPFTLKKHEDEIVVNPTLTFLFARDYGITLPEFDSDKDTLETYMNEVESLVENKGWRVVKECNMGLVSFLKISMYNDLIKNEAQLKQNPIIRAFAGERNEINTIVDGANEFDHDACRSVDSFQVLPADSSQQDAIALSQNGVSFVMEGPPGTGKSQTIANIIAQALADGKKVLFVSEKMAALDVVYRRLSDVHLDDFCLSLHSHKANKKEILSQLGASVDLKPIKVKSEELAKLTRLDVIREQLKTYVQDIHKTIMPLEMSLYEVYGAISELGDLPDIKIHIDDVDKLTKDDVNRLALIVTNLDKAREILGPQWYKNPWQGITNSYLEVSKKRDLQYNFRDAIRILSDVEACKLIDKTLAEVLSLESLDSFLSLYEHAIHCKSMPNSWFNSSVDQEERLVCAISDQKQTIVGLKHELSGKYGEEYFNFNGQIFKDKLISAMELCCTVLRDEKINDDALSYIDNDLNQMHLMRENCRLLIEALDSFSCKYSNKLAHDYTAVETMLTICDMLREKRSLTEWYFSAKDSVALHKYVEDLKNRYSALTEKKQLLCERYSGDLLETEDVSFVLEPIKRVLSTIGELVNVEKMNYNILSDIAEFDLDKIQCVEDALNSDKFATMQNLYGLSMSSTISDVQNLMHVIEKVRCTKIIPSWQTLSSRNKAKQLLGDVINKSTKLENNKKELSNYFDRFSFALDVNNLTEETIDKFKLADSMIPEAVTIVASCNNDEAYKLLDAINRNKKQYDDLSAKIENLRKEYRIRGGLTNNELLSLLKECQDAVSKCMPCSAWATSKTEATQLLEKVSTLAQNLVEKKAKFLETYEESVFSLDYVGMLNRFKTEYTNVFKIFKSSYKEDVKQVRLAFKAIRKKVTDEEIVSLLQDLRQYNEEIEHYKSFSARVSQLMDINEYDIDFDWTSVGRRFDYFDAVRKMIQDDATTYEFITKNGWNIIHDVLEKFEELKCWFDNNEQAKTYYSALYTGLNTDTVKICSALEHAKSICSLFSSPDSYVSYMLASNNDLQAVKNAKQNMDNIVDVRRWFVEKSAEITGFVGVEYNEGFDGWTNILSQLENFENVISVVGENAGYAIASKYETDRDNFEKYFERLAEISKIYDYSKSVHLISAETDGHKSAGVTQLISDIRTTVHNVSSLCPVYLKLSECCNKDFSKLCIGELVSDFESVLIYRDTRDCLPEIESEARCNLGENYNGKNTDWDLIRSTIEFSNKVNTLLGDVASSELVSDFVCGKSLYTDTYVAELRQYYHGIQCIEELYPVLEKYNDLSAKVRYIVDISGILDEAQKTRNAVVTSAYSSINYSEIVGDLEKLIDLQKTQVSFDENIEKAKELLSIIDLSDQVDWTYWAEAFNHLKQVKRIISNSSFDEEIIRFVTNAIGGITVATYSNQLEKLIRNRHLPYEIVGLFANKTDLEAYDLAKLTRRLKKCDELFETMDAWIDFRDCRKACEEIGLKDFIETADDVYYQPGRLKDVFLKGFYYEWFEKICPEIESVSTFRVRTQEDRVESFCELDSHQLPIDQMRIREKLIRDMPRKNSFGGATDEISLLLHELNKKRKVMPLRKLFRTIPNLVLKLKPCLMMSPLSVSYFLEAETYRFDMVIFDEASQIFPQDAIGSIFRAKQVIIAGDSKQLPPTNFFAANTSNDTDFDSDDDFEEINSDSILEEASNCNMTKRSLLWHYRSRYEELISFANRQIYSNNLITFPSSIVQAVDTGVEYVYVENGVYENRCNRAEAQEIVRLVAEHIKNHPERSLGIIAFSESQQSVIEDEINKFRLKNTANERFFNEDRDEPFFIKNLENVQGDERDTIIFSICYAKNEEGRMYMRFGPLGHNGGERRLNVAVTRAKHNIKLVGSILPEDIDLNKTNSEGVRMLRSYIEFAMHGSDALPKVDKKNSLYEVDTFSEQVGKFLVYNGYKVKMNVGSSDYTIDIAVEHPNKPGYYVAGVECDGSSYYMAKTVSDREHLRTAVLERMGWKMHRVWSTEWIRNLEAEQERLLNFVRYASDHSGESSSNEIVANAVENFVEIEEVSQIQPTHVQKFATPYNLPRYQEGNWWDKPNNPSKDNLSNVAETVRAIVKVEQPIHMDLLYKRVGPSFTTGKATQAVKDTIDEAIEKRMKGEIVIEQQFIRFVNSETVQPRYSPIGQPDRNIEHISIEEIAAAMEKILVGTYGIDRSELCSEAAKVFGFERNGPKIKQRTNEAVDYLVVADKVSDYDDKILVLEK